MRDFLMWLVLSLVIGVLAFMTLGPVYIGLVWIGWAPPLPLRGHCTTEVRDAVSAIAGLDFEASNTDCDLLDKDNAITIVVSRTGEAKKTAIFKYEPG